MSTKVDSRGPSPLSPINLAESYGCSCRSAENLQRVFETSVAKLKEAQDKKKITAQQEASCYSSKDVSTNRPSPVKEIIKSSSAADFFFNGDNEHHKH